MFLKAIRIIDKGNKSLKALLCIVALAFIFFDSKADCGNISSSFTTSQTIICGATPTTISFANTSTGAGAAGASYTWYLNGVSFATTSGLTAPGTSAISAIGTYTYMLIAFDASVPCKDTAIVTVDIRPVPAASFTFNSNNQCAGTALTFNSTSTGTGAYTTYSWNFGDGNTSTAAAPTHAYTSGGTYNVTMTASNGTGCTSTSGITTVTVLPGPTAIISGDDGDGNTIYCLTPAANAASDPVEFFNNSTAATSYSWNFGDGTAVFNTASTSTFIHSFTAYGTYTVSMTATGANGCTNTATLTVVFDKYVAALFSITLPEYSGCIPHTLAPVNTSINASQYVWNFGDGTPSITTNSLVAPSHTYTVGGSYSITLTASNSCNSSTNIINPITVVGPPIINFTATPTPGCSPQLVTFSNTTTGAANTSSFYWDFGNGTTLNGVKNPPPITYYHGTWTIMLVSGNACATDTLYRTIVVDTIPVALINCVPSEGCTPLTVVTSNNSTGGNLNYAWYVDGALVSTAAGIPNQVFTAPAGNAAVTHTIRLLLTNHCGTDDTTVTITVHPQIAVTLTPATATICAGDNVSFSQTSQGDVLTYLWDFGNGNTSTSATPTNQVYPLAGTYTVSLIVSGYCGKDTVYSIVTVNPIPLAPTAAGTTICSGTSATLTATAPGGTYTWYDAASGGTLLNTGASYTTPTLTANTTYYVQATALACTGPRTAVTVVITPTPVAPTATGATICAGDSTILTATAPGGNYEWYNAASGGTLLASNAAYHTPPLIISTTYYVQTTVAACTSARTPVTVTVNPIPAAPTVAPVSICTGSTATFTATAPGGTYQWYDAASAGTLLNTGASFTSPALTATTTYYVQSIINACTGPRTGVTVTVNPIPVADIAPDVSTGCGGFTVNFNNNSTLGGTYAWAFAGATPAGSALYTPPLVTFNTAGNNMVILTVTVAGCTMKDTVYINVKALPVPTFTTSPATGCSPLVAAINNTSAVTVGDTYTWNFGNGNTSTLQNPSSQTYTTTGVDSIGLIKLIITGSNGCKDSVSHTVTVHPNPTALYMVSADTVCLNTGISFFNSSIGATNYQWSFGDAATSTLSNPTHTYTTPNHYTSQLIASTVYGCNDTMQMPIVVDSIPVAAFTNTSVCLGTATQFTNTSSGSGNLSWNFGDGSALSTVNNPAHLYPVNGIYNATLSITNAFGCSSSVTHTVTVGAIPVAAFTPSNNCLLQNSVFTDQSTGTLSGWSWDFGDASALSTQQNPVHVYTNAGTYTVTLIALGTIGCADTVAHSITINPVPTTNFTFTSTCINDTMFFNSTSLGAPNTFVWFFGDGFSDNSNNPTPKHLYSATGIYTVTLVAGYAGTGCTQTLLLPVTVFPRTVPAFTSSTSCLNASTVFTDATSNAPTQWNWNFGDGSAHSTTQNPSHTYTSAGTFTVTLTTQNATGCIDSVAVNTIVHPLPLAAFTFDTVCAGSTTIFTDQSASAVAWTWNFGDGSAVSPVNSPTHTYPAAGTYTVSLVVANVFGCTDTILHTVTVNPNPVAAFTSATACQGYSTVFTDNSTGAIQWSWDFDDASAKDTLQSPSHIYTNAGSFNVVLTITNTFGCSNSITQTIVVNAVPSALFNNTTVCAGQSTGFTDQSIGAVSSWSWNFGDASPLSTLQNPTHTYTNAGTYTVTLVSFTTSGCSDTVSKIITVNPVPSANFTFANTCKNDTAFFNSTSLGTPDTFTWNFGDGFSDNSNNPDPKHVYSAAGTFPVQLTVGYVATGCSHDTTISITIYPRTLPSFTNTNVCLNATSLFTDATLNVPTQWVWNFGDGSAVSTIQNPAHTYTNTGTYPVSLTTQNAFGCIDSVTINTTVYSLPVAAFSADTVCANSATTFSDQSTSAVSWSWDFGDGSAVSTVNSPTHTYPAAGTYTVSLIVGTIFGCTDTLVKNVVVNPNPVAAYSASTACQSYATLFSDSSVSAISWSWDFGDVTVIDTNQSPSHIYANPGSFNATLTVTNSFGCSNSISHTIVVNSIPTALFNNTTVCLGQSSSFFDQSIGTVSNWAWDFGDASPLSNLQNPTHTYTNAGTYSVTFVSIATSGCSDTLVKNITVNPVPTANFTFANTCTNDTVFFNSTSGGTPDTFTWTFGDGYADNSNNPSPKHVYNTAGTYSINLSVGFAATGCSHDTTIVITIYPRTKPGFTSTSPCLNAATVFTDTTTNSPIHWAWDFGDNSLADTTQNPTHTYTTAGTFTVTLITQNAFGCLDAVHFNSIVHPLPVAAFSSDSVCIGSVSTFTDQSVSAVTWHWDFGDGSAASTANSPIHTYSSAGTHIVELIVNNVFGCSDTLRQNVIVDSLPVAGFTATRACFGYATVFTDTSTGGPVHWSWDFGDSSPLDTTQSPSHIYPNTGNYTVTLTVSNSFGCSHSISQLINIVEQPQANFTFTNACARKSVQFTDASTGNGLSTYAWDFGDGGNSTVQSPSHTYTQSGNNNVTLIVSNTFGCIDTIVKPITINTVPIPLFTANVSCQGTVTAFTDHSTDSVAISSWYYDFNDGNNSASQNPNYIYALAGTYNVSLTVTNINGCDSTITLPVTVNVLPTANFTTDTVCIGTATTFTDVSTGNPNQWVWDFGDGGNSTTGPVTSHVYAAAGSYLSSLSISNGAACTDQAFKIVVVRGDVIAGIKANNNVCKNAILTVIDSSTINNGFILSSTWDFGDGSPIVSGFNATHTYATTGTFVVTHVVVSDGGCSSTIHDTVVVSPLPSAHFSTTNTCQSQLSVFTDNSTGPPINWSWNFGDAGTSILQNPTHTYATAGVYTVQLKVNTGSGCADSISIPVTVYEKPVASFTSTVVCWGDTTDFINTSTLINGTVSSSWWDFGDGVTSSQTNPQHIFIAQNDSFNVSLAIVSNFGCKDTVTKIVTTHPLSIFNFAPEMASGCDKFTVKFNDNSTIPLGAIVNWLWDFGDGNLTYTQNPIHTYDSAGTYFVSLTITNSYGCVMKDTLNYPVIVYPHPIADFTPSSYSVSIFDPKITFLNGSNGATMWDWDLDDFASSVLENPSHIYPDTGSYTITQIAINQYGCRDTVKKIIRVFGETTIYIPNAFTPDHNGLNDAFAPKSEGLTEFEMLIFDRWGHQLFKTHDINEGWNGLMNGSGEPVEEGVYVYKINTTDILKNKHSYVGNFTLVR